jgi:hypothetical protein
MRATKNQLVFILFIVSSLMAVSIPPSFAAEWDERICETGNYTPLFLYGVWGSSNHDVFFAGDRGYIFHYDGSQCSVMWENPYTGKIENLYDIWGSSPFDVFAVGGNSGEILHYDGNYWTLTRQSTAEQQLYGIWGDSPKDVFAAGSGGVILHYDGYTWSEMNSGTTFTLYDIWGFAPDDVYAVGYGGTILHYDGERWNTVSFQGRKNLYGVWGSSNHDVYAVGDGPYVNQPSGSVFYSDGDTWLWNEKIRYSGRYLRGVWGSSPNNVFFVGGVGPLIGANSGVILHHDGVHTVVHDEPPGMVQNIWGSSGSDVYAVGFGYSILHYDGSGTVPTTTVSSNTTAPSTTTTSAPLIISTSTTSVSISTTIQLTTSTSIVAATTSTGIVTSTSTAGTAQTTTSVQPATTTSTVKLCPIVFIAAGDTEKLGMLRIFRDRILMNSAEGKEYVFNFYKHSPEITSIMITNPLLAVKAADVLNTYMPVIRSALTRGEISLTVIQNQEVISILDLIYREASPLLQQDLRQIKHAIQSGVICNTLNIK